MEKRPSVRVVECGSNDGGSLFRFSDHEMRSCLDNITTARLLLDCMLDLEEEYMKCKKHYRLMGVKVSRCPHLHRLFFVGAN